MHSSSRHAFHQAARTPPADMADPVSLLTTIAGAAGACVKISKVLIELGITFASAKATVSALAAECIATKTVLERLSDLIRARPSLLAPKPGGTADLEPCFRSIAKAVIEGTEELEKMIARVTRGRQPGDMHAGHKLLYLFQEINFKSTVEDIRQQRATLAMVMSCVQRYVSPETRCESVPATQALRAWQ